MFLARSEWDVPEYRAADVVFKIARTPAELAAFWELRRVIFCEEQGVFDETDVDGRDESIIPIVCVSLVAGMEDEVVGVVRIHEHGPEIWWGSRLAVRRDFRQRHRLSASVSIRNRQPHPYACSIGAGLIYKAVSTAQALGCRRFDAHVQQQNAPFFERLHWLSLADVELHGRPHRHMRADLAYYPAATHDVYAARVA